MKPYRIIVLSLLWASSSRQILLVKAVPTCFESVFYALPIHKQKKLLASYKKKKKYLLQACVREPYWVHWYIDLGTFKIESIFVGGMLLGSCLYLFVAILESEFRFLTLGQQEVLLNLCAYFINACGVPLVMLWFLNIFRIPHAVKQANKKTFASLLKKEQGKSSDCKAI